MQRRSASPRITTDREMRVFTAAAAAAAASVTATDTDTQHDMMSFELVCPFIHLSD